jgi:hypothetical protein
MARIAIALIVTLGVAACDRSGTLSPGEKPVARDLTIAQLRNAEYPSEWTRSGKAYLVDGQYREAAAPGAATEVVVKATTFYAVGDLDGDGSADAVIVLESDPGGSGVFFDLVPVLNRQGEPQVLTPLPLGDRVEVNGVTLKDGLVDVQILKHSPDDPQCCPSLDVTMRYRLGPNGFISEGQDPSRTSASPDARKTVQSWTPTAPMRS